MDAARRGRRNQVLVIDSDMIGSATMGEERLSLLYATGEFLSLRRIGNNVWVLSIIVGAAPEVSR